MGWLSNLLSPQPPAYVPPEFITMFGQQVRRPPLCDELTGFFDRHDVTIRFYRDRWDNQREAVIPRLARSALNEARMMECYAASWTCELMLRGLKFRNAAGQSATPKFAGNFFIVDTIEEPDGAAYHVVATGFGRNFSPDEYRLADQERLAQSVAWRREPLALVASRHAADAGQMPLYRLATQEVAIHQPTKGDGQSGGVSLDFPEAWT